ncbi:hypothetical protein F2Q68_00029026 [Brassica cretica]|uniref:Uncharacterized protein n=1 Tax=Brassica cretica TaxID=69181 RepID=A0A8S9G6Y6_BRACR|nr:hypothetical protein F2Q68_00029026 [Brassica cretica]
MDVFPAENEDGGYDRALPAVETDKRDDGGDLCRICRSPEGPNDPLKRIHQAHFNGSSQVKPKTETEKRQSETTVNNKGRGDKSTVSPAQLQLRNRFGVLEDHVAELSS